MKSKNNAKKKPLHDKERGLAVAGIVASSLRQSASGGTRGSGKGSFADLAIAGSRELWLIMRIILIHAAKFSVWTGRVSVRLDKKSCPESREESRHRAGLKPWTTFWTAPGQAWTTLK